MSSLESLLGLQPIAISFVAEPPAGVPRVDAIGPAGCAYWKRAAAGEVFHTVAADHKQCPVGAHTHNVPLDDTDKKNLEGLVGTMVHLQYLTMAEIPQIPTRKTPMSVAVYAPLAKAPVPPDLVMVHGDVRTLMLLSEAAQAAGVVGDAPTLGRPTCAVIPQAINADRTAASFACVGNRVYTGLADGEGWFAIPGDKLAAVEERLAVIINANRELERFHAARLPRA